MVMHWVAHFEGAPKRVNHAAVVVGKVIYSFGGYCTRSNSRDHTSIDVHVLNTTTYRWTKHPISDLPYFENDDLLPFKRYGHTAVLYEEKIYIWGGRNDIGSCSELFCFDTVWHCWRAAKTSGDQPAARDGHSACVWRNRMFIFGGYESEADMFASNVFVLNLDTLHWSCIYTSGEEPTVRDFHTAVCIDDKMFMYGGRGMAENGAYSELDEIYCPHVWYLDLITCEWHRPAVSGLKPIGRRSHSAFVYNQNIYIFGGYNSIEGQHYNDMWEFNPRNNTWKAVTPLGNIPSKRRRHICVLVEDKAFLFGGTSPARGVFENISKLVDYSDMHVLDMQPSLRTLCMLVILKHNIKDSILPKQIRTELNYLNCAAAIKTGRLKNTSG